MALLLGPLTLSPVQGQTLDSVGGITGKLARYERRGPQEKLFLHFDRPLYLSGETMWFKVYAADGTYSRPLALSGVAYVEVLDARQKPVLQGKIALKNAVGQGSFALPVALPSGSYTVRAYTSWMKNFAPETYFHAAVTVLNTLAASGTAASQDSVAYDVQFFPEGGDLVQGLRSKVAFKVTDRAGRGVAAQGQVLDQRGGVGATFKTLRLGMGSFSLTPTADQQPYTAVLTLSSGRTIRRPLPPVRPRGYVLRLEVTDQQQLTLRVDATSSQPETLFLLAHARQKTAVAARAQLVNGHAEFSIRTAELLPGISHFTVFNAAGQPVAERLYFQRPAPGQQLALTAQADQAQYSLRDKVSVQLAVAAGPPASDANLSMAVYRLDSLNAAIPTPSLAHYLWLTSDLKGTVENPAYYFTAPEPEAAEAADNLMLTQGWSRWRWEDVLAPNLTSLLYAPEPSGHVVRARLTRAGTRTPRPGVLAYLASPSRITRLSNALSDADGLLQFELSDFYGARDLVLQANPRQDTTSQFTVLDPFSTRYAAGHFAPSGLSPHLRPAYEKRHLQTQLEKVYAGSSRNRYRPGSVDSLAFFGPPDEKYLLDRYTRFKVLEEVLREYVPGVVVRIRKDGFHLLIIDKVNKTVLNENPMVLLDGVPVFDINKMMAMNPLKIRKLEVVDSRYFHGLAVYNGLVSFTTYGGNLEDFPLDPHVLVQRYEGLQLQREFYAPRYDTPQAQQSRRPDLRNLLYWNPDITLSGANASPLSFYAGDQAGRYLVVVQGLSAAGQPGSTSFTFEVKSAL